MKVIRIIGGYLLFAIFLACAGWFFYATILVGQHTKTFTRSSLTRINYVKGNQPIAASPYGIFFSDPANPGTLFHVSDIALDQMEKSPGLAIFAQVKEGDTLQLDVLKSSLEGNGRKDVIVEGITWKGQQLIDADRVRVKGWWRRAGEILFHLIWLFCIPVLSYLYRRIWPAEKAAENAVA